MILDLSLFAAALLLGALAAALSRPKPPRLDAERLFKVCQSVLLWGRAEREGADEQAWARAVAEGVLYHPAGRRGWDKLERPSVQEILVPALPGERALVDELLRLQPGLERFQRMFSHDERALSAVMDDPRLLGPDYDPARWLAPDLDWEQVARWSEGVVAALRRRLEHMRLVLVHDDEGSAEARQLHQACDPLKRSCLSCQDLSDEELAQALLDPLEDLSERLVLVVLGRAGPRLLGAMLLAPALRDRVQALFFLGAMLADEEPSAASGSPTWGRGQFTQEALDTELRRSTPYAFLARLLPDALPPGDGRTPWRYQRLPEPPIPASGRHPVAVVDLGASPADAQALAPAVLARSLLLSLVVLLEIYG